MAPAGGPTPTPLRAGSRPSGRIARLLAGLLAGVLLAGGALAASPQGAVSRTRPPGEAVGDPRLGARLSDDERCQECHGPDGHGPGEVANSEGRVPKLGGQSLRYLVKQLDDFRSGARSHDVMTMMARSVDRQTLLHIAAYFASQRPMQGDAGGAPGASRRLFEQGDGARGLPACASCHGIDGRGLATAEAPAVAGQEWRYLEKQLLDWRSGERRNSPAGVMNQALKGLSDEEIRQMAAYLSGLP